MLTDIYARAVSHTFQERIHLAPDMVVENPNFLKAFPGNRVIDKEFSLLSILDCGVRVYSLPVEDLSSDPQRKNP